MSINIDLSKTQLYLEWLKIKFYLDSNAINASKRVVRRGEVYKCNLGQGIGSEENKERPCVIIQYDIGNSKSPNTIVAPITHSASNLPIVIHIKDQYDSNGNLILDGNVLLGNIVCVSKARLGDYITRLEPADMEKVNEAISISLDTKRYYDTLNNILNDKLIYINKLKDIIVNLKSELSKKDRQLKDLEELKHQFGFVNNKQLRDFIKINIDKQ